MHCVNNFYTWTDTTDGDNTDPDGTLFTNFLDTLNNKCSDETTTCTLDRDCSGIGNGKCGFAGHRDWCIPNIKKLQSIVDYSTSLPASSVPGATAASGFGYWSATTIAGFPGFAWFVGFNNGDVNGNNKDNGFPARAVRPCE